MANVFLPTIESYGHYTNKNYGAHCLTFTDSAGNSFWFSYRTLVAFQKYNKGVVVRENDWGPTTGKHLNAIDGGNRDSRVSGAVFERLYQKTFKTRKAGV